MNQQQVDRVFDIILKAAGEMQKGRVDASLALLEGIREPDLGEWPLAILKASEQLRRAKELADQAEALKRPKSAEAYALWRQADDACTAAQVKDRAQRYSRLGSTTVLMEDLWPQLVMSFEQHLRARRLHSEQGA